MLVSTFDYFLSITDTVSILEKAYCNLGDGILCVDMHACALSSVFSGVPLSQCCCGSLFVLNWSDGEVTSHNH